MPPEGESPYQALPGRRSPAATAFGAGCTAVLALFFVAVCACILAPTHADFDAQHAQADRILLQKLARAIDARGALPTPEGFAHLQPEGGDIWGTPVVYTPACTAGRGTYTLVSYGKDGRPGGDGPSADIVVEGPSSGELRCP